MKDPIKWWTTLHTASIELSRRITNAASAQHRHEAKRREREHYSKSKKGTWISASLERFGEELEESLRSTASAALDDDSEASEAAEVLEGEGSAGCVGGSVLPPAATVAVATAVEAIEEREREREREKVDLRNLGGKWRSEKREKVVGGVLRFLSNDYDGN